MPHPEGTPSKPRPLALVVDDEESLCEITCAWLESVGFDTLCAHDGNKALEQLRQHQIDLLFTDMIMPGGLDGESLARAAREMQPALRVILAGGNMSNDFDPEPGALGPSLGKPYRKMHLLSALAAVGFANGEFR